LPGTIALGGIVLTGVSLLLHRRKQGWSRILMLSGGLVTLLSSLAWILSPKALAWRWDWMQGYGIVLTTSHGPSYEALFGGYITFVGSVLTSASAFVTLRRHGPCHAEA